MQPPKLPTKAGAAVLAIGGITATLTADTAREWLELLAQYGPLVLSVWLLFILYRGDRKHNECRQELLKLHRELSALETKVARLEQAQPAR